MKQIGKQISALLLSLALLVSSVPEALAADGTASSMQLAKTEGTVTISSSSGKSISQIQNMRLYNGYQLETGEKSYAWVNLDSSKLTKLDAASKASIRKNGKKLEILLDSGNIFFNVSEPLKDDESLNIQTSTMVVGIRGTCGWAKILDEKTTQLSLLEGKVDVTVTDPVTGQEKTAQISGGETAVCKVYDSTKEGSKCDILQGACTEEDIDGFVLKELASDAPLTDKIYQDSGIDLRGVTPEKADQRLAEQENAVAQKLETIQTGQEKQEETASPAWGDDSASSEETKNKEDTGSKPDSGSDKDSDRDDSSESTSPSVPSYLPATASVSEIAASLQVHDAVTVATGSDAITLSGNLTVPGGKTLNFGGPLTVTAPGSLTVYGTANANRNLINYGSITVSSSNTLYVTGYLENHNRLYVTSTGRLMVSGALSGPLTPAEGASVQVGSYSGVTLPENWTFVPSGSGYALEYHQSFTVDFQSAGGSAVTSQTIQSGQTASRPADPAREGYAFTGWYTDAACTVSYNFSAPVTGNLTLYAGWEASAFTVTFSANGGSGGTSQRVQSGETVSRPADPAREGYTFTGWYTDAACTASYNFSAPVTGNLTLYAGWEAVPEEPPQPPQTPSYTVTFHTNGGSAVSSATVTEGETAAQPTAPPTRDGYTFTGWFTDDTCSAAYDFSTPVTENLTLYAGWNFTGYIVTFDTGSGDAVPSQTIGDPAGGLATRPDTDPAWADGVFGDWYSDAAYTTPYDFSTPITSSVTIYARWKHQVVFHFQLGTGETANYPDGTQVTDGISNFCWTGDTMGAVIGTFTGFTRTGYTFLGWSLEANGPVVSNSAAVEKNTDLYAQWEAETYTVRFDLNGGAGTADSQTVTYPGTATEPASPDRLGYFFKGWFTDLTDSSTAYNFAAPVTGNLTLYAQWEQGVIVTFVTNGGSTVDPITHMTTEVLAEAELPTPTREGYTFEGWFTDEACETSYFPFSITEDLTLYAKWSAPVVRFNLGQSDKSAWIASALTGYALEGNDSIAIIEVPAGKKLGEYWVTPADGTNMSVRDSADSLTFMGWTDNVMEPWNGTAFASDTVVTGDMDLYAIWGCTVTFLDYDGSSLGLPDQTVKYSKTATAPDTPARAGATFDGWKKPQASENYDFDSPVAQNLTLQAQWLATVEQDLNVANNPEMAAGGVTAAWDTSLRGNFTISDDMQILSAKVSLGSSFSGILQSSESSNVVTVTGGTYNWLLDHWVATPDITGTPVDSTAMVTESVRYYAVWKKGEPLTP